MTHSIECITNAIPKIRACTVRGQHLTTCTDELCNGCLPRPAHVGYLCENCWDRVNDALTTADRMLHHLNGIDHAIRHDTSAGNLGPSVPIPPVPLALEAIQSWRNDYTGDARTWVSTIRGATHAIHFTKAVYDEAAAHPIEETEHPLPSSRCPRCNRRTLAWKPPAHFLDRVHIACLDKLCGFECDQSSFETIATHEAAIRQRKAIA